MASRISLSIADYMTASFVDTNNLSLDPLHARAQQAAIFVILRGKHITNTSLTTMQLGGRMGRGSARQVIVPSKESLSFE